MNKFFLPKLSRLYIDNYTLYKCPQVFDFSKKLNIIYGTNGVGKSTLLMLLLFSIIGPYRGGIKTKTRQEQRRDNRPIYNDSFFKDRMPRIAADPTIKSEFTIGSDAYTVVHSLDDGILKSVTVNGSNLPGKLISYRTYEMKFSKQRNDGSKSFDDLSDYLIYSYHKKLEESTELPGGINTLISMLLDVMFFDEGRKLTFWNRDLQETIVGKYIVDADFYVEYVEQKLNVTALESAYKKKSETYNYMRKFFEKERTSNSNNISNNDELRDKLEDLEQKIEELTVALREDQKRYNSLDYNLVNKSREEESIKERLLYIENQWYANLLPDKYAAYYDKFIGQMVDGICPVCGEKHSFNLSAQNCIVCGEDLEFHDSPDLLKIDLQRKNDQQLLYQIKGEIDATRKALDQLRGKINTCRSEIDSLNLQKNKIEAQLSPDDDITESSDKRRLNQAMEERSAALGLLNEEKKKEDAMRKVIEEGLADNFSTFRKSFLGYTSSFFGEAHSEGISMPFGNEDTPDKLMIQFSLDGKERAESYMLSESQRIFTDLAFRFSVLSAFHDASFFICETPDSTLDIFHEENAVKTFLRFLENGNSLILSANARQSNLISSIYKKLDKSDISIIDLTKISFLALPNNYSFSNYIERE